MQTVPLATLVADLLREIDATARLADFTETSDGRWYAIRVETPGDVAKSLVLPKLLLLGAETNAAARRTLTNILRAEVIMWRSRDAMQRSRDVLAGVERDPVCPCCSKPTPPGESRSFEHGEDFPHRVLQSIGASQRVRRTTLVLRRIPFPRGRPQAAPGHREAPRRGPFIRPGPGDRPGPSAWEGRPTAAAWLRTGVPSASQGVRLREPSPRAGAALRTGAD
jgi:hypothetical protein